MTGKGHTPAVPWLTVYVLGAAIVAVPRNKESCPKAAVWGVAVIQDCRLV
jgi:hypothetical protein